ncbi:MAG: DUF1565 domain-containing protein [Planctomycetes bacterium]|nr:DUF1565 domain-containing protein [Planctomycetota bacterium]
MTVRITVARFLSFALGLTLQVGALATDYYVDSFLGSDQNDGTAARPWKTLTYACSRTYVQGDAVIAVGRFDGLNGEAFPLVLPAHLTLRALGVGAPAEIDAGGRAALHIDPVGTSAAVRGFALIRGTPAITAFASQGSNGLTISDNRIEGDVRTDEYPGTWSMQISSNVIHGRLDMDAAAGRYYIQANTVIASVDAIKLWASTYGASDSSITANRVTCSSGSCIIATGDDSSIRVDGNVIDGLGTADVGVSAWPYYFRSASGNVIRRINGWGMLVGGRPWPERAVVSGNDLGECTKGISANFTTYGEGASMDRNTIRVVDGPGISWSRWPYSSPGARIQDSLIHVANGGLGIEFPVCSGGLELYRTQISAGATRQGSVGVLAASTYLDMQDCRIDGFEGGVRVSLARCYYPVYQPSLLARNVVNGAGVAIDVRPDNPWTSVHLIENDLGLASTGIRWVGDAQDVVVRRNRFVGAGQGLILSPPLGAQFFRVERCEVVENDFGVEVDLGGALAAVSIVSNTIASNRGVGIDIRRQAFTGSLSMLNCIIAGHSPDVGSASFAPGDDVRANLAQDGGLLGAHPSNIFGMPHFASLPTLLPTSPCIRSGVDPATGVADRDMGCVQSGHAESLQALWLSSNRLDMRVLGTSGTAALMACSALPAFSSALTVCDDQLGLDVNSLVFVIAGSINFGRFDAVFEVPPVPFTVSFQAVRNLVAAPFSCGLSNVRVVNQ